MKKLYILLLALSSSAPAFAQDKPGQPYLQGSFGGVQIQTAINENGRLVGKVKNGGAKLTGSSVSGEIDIQSL